MLTPNAIVVFVYLLSMVALGVYLSRYVKNEDDFFLAGRSLNKWVIAGSIMSTNVAAIYLVGPAGAAYGGGGVSTLLIAWTGNMIAAVSALFFVPHLRRMRITTISEYLEERYGVAMRLLPAGLWILYYACFAGVGMCTLSTVLAPVLGVRVEGLIIFVGGGVLIYCFFSGLIGAAYSSVVQAFIMILGGLILAPLALKQVGGLGGLYEQLPQSYFVFWKSGEAGVWPSWKDVVMFIMLGLPYWCTSQYMVQRSFAGRSVRAASRGVILAALMTGPLTLSFIIPGICGRVLYGGVVRGDEILPILLRDFLPAGLAGLILASLIAASNSTASALLSSLSTLAQHDFYRRFIPGKDTKHYVWVARIATLIGGAVGIVFAFVAREHGIIKAVYDLMGFFEPPIFVIVAGALFWKAANTSGAVCAGVIGIAMNFVMRFVLKIDGATQAILSFPISAIALVIGTKASASVSRGKTVFDVEGSGKIAPGRSGRIGIAWAVLSLAAFVICSFCESALPKPGNMFIFLLLMMSFVLGCYFAVPALVPESVEEEAQPDGVGGSLMQHVMGSGWTWLGVYVVAIGLMFTLYYSAEPNRDRAQLTIGRVEVKAIADALEAYSRERGAYPAEDGWIDQLREASQAGAPFLPAVMDQTDAWGNAIVYRLRDDGSRVLYSVGADGQADTQDDIVAEDADR
jgi:SSS family solute:Na+ symporter